MRDISKIKIRNAYSEGKDLILVYNNKDLKKRLRIKNYPWYFTIKKEDWFKHKLMHNTNVLSLATGGFCENGNYWKLCFKGSGGKVNQAAQTLMKIFEEMGIEMFETDVHSAKRYLVDYPCEISDEYDILYWDIETDDTTRRIEIGKYRILSIGCIDNKGNKFFFDGEEEQLLKDFLNLIKKYDVIAGWNTDEFDLPYLKGMYDENGKWISGRMDLYGLKFDWYKVACIDMLKRARKVFKEDASLKSYSLENISQYFLGRGKVKFEGKVIDLYNKDKEKFKEYNMQDVLLLKELDEETGMIDLVAKECEMSKTLITQFKGLYVSEVLDNMILREAHAQGIMAPSRKKGDHVDYAGGLVFDPKVGLHKNVYVFDFKSLYPSIILTSNIGFDTVDKHDGFTTEDFHTRIVGTPIGNVEKNSLLILNKNIKDVRVEDDTWIENPGTKVKFYKHKQSVIATVVERLVEERQVYKQKRLELVAKGKMKSKEYEKARANEIIIKELSNSVYGIMGLQSMRYYSLETAESITKMGHYLLKYSRDFFNLRKGMDVIYGDTDSVFVKCDHEIDTEETLLGYHKRLELILKKYNIDKSWIYLKYEKRFESVIMLSKKMYVGYVSNIEGKEVKEFVAKGIDLVKKATLPIMTESQESVINLLLADGSIKDVKERVDYYKSKMLNQNFSFDDLKISTKVGKELSEYKNVNAPHVRIAKELEKLNGKSDNIDTSYIVVDSTQTPSTLAHRGNFTGLFDRSYYWTHKVLPGLTRVLEVVFPDIKWDELYTIKKTTKKNKLSEGQLPLF